MMPIRELLGQPLVARLGWMLVHSLWQGATVAGVAALVLRALRSRSANARYLVGCAAMTAMIAWPALTVRSIEGPTISIAGTPASIEKPPIALETAPSTALKGEPADPLRGQALVSQPVSGPRRETLEEWLEPLLPWLVLAWGAGVIALSIRLGGGWLLVQRLKRVGTRALDDAWSATCQSLAQRLAIRRRVRLFESAIVTVPMVAGWLRPVILVPASAFSGLTPAELEAILVHELAHIRRHDYLFNLLQSFAETLLFYHPAVWWLSRRVREEREHCCDDWAVAICGDRLLYAGALATIEGLRGPSWQLAPAANGGSLIGRVRRLLGVTSPTDDRPGGWLAGTLALGVLFLVAASSALLAPRSADAVDLKVPDGKMAITGRVVDPAEQPVAGADVVVIADHIRPFAGGQNNAARDRVLGHCKTGDDGRFKLIVDRTSSTQDRYVKMFAMSPGFGLARAKFSTDVQNHIAVIKLGHEQVIKGRVLDIQGQPAAGVKLAARTVGDYRNGWLDGVRFHDPLWELPVQPPSAITDADGRFTFHGVGRGQAALIGAYDDRFAPHEQIVESEEGKELAIALEPARWLEGKVTFEDTGQPVSNTHVEATAWVRSGGRGRDVRVDAQGHYRIKLGPADYYAVAAYPPAGSSYLIRHKRPVTLPRGVLRQTLDLTLPQGNLVRGRIKEAGSGKPVAGASVEYRPQRRGDSNLRDDILTGWSGTVLSDVDGQFAIGVPPGAGTLLVVGPDRDYVHLEVGQRVVDVGLPGGERICPDGMVAVNLAAGSPPKDVEVTLRRGVTVKGRVVGPDGQAVAKAIVLTRANVEETLGFTGIFPVDAVDGLFELHGLDPAKSYPVLLLDPDHEWGAKVEISGSLAGNDRLTVRLAPCGTARVRVVDRAGNPIAKYRPLLNVVVTSGPHPQDPNVLARWLTRADTDLNSNIDRKHYWGTKVLTDTEGRVTLPALIPGATYWLWDHARDNKFPLYEFTVKPGETREVPDFVTTRRR